MTQPIPLNKLVPSKRNVRRHNDPDADAELKADIEARGLLQNLIVTAVKKPRGCFAVEGGERRRRALSALAGEGKLAKNYPIDCLVLDDIGTNALEASFAENFQHLVLNPADECLAFRHFIENGAEVEGLAKRFGLTVRFIEGRLRLADLAPIVFDALGRGEITLDVAKAYASSPDRERQALVFEQMATSYNRAEPASVRRMMRDATVAASDPRARFVGESAYVEAGGRIERDLFSDDDSIQFLDIAILERLATEKLGSIAATVATEGGFAWVRPSLDAFVSWDQTRDLERVMIEVPPLSDDEQTRVEALQAEAGEQMAILEDEASSEEERTAAETEIERLDAAIEAIADKPPAIDDALRPTIGTFVVLDRDGQPRLHNGFYVEKQERPTEDGPPAVDDDDAARPTKLGLSQRLVDELAIQRRDILAVHVAADPDFALDLAIFLMVDKPRYCERKGSSLNATRPSDPVTGFKTPDAAATVALNETEAALNPSWTGGGTLAERFDAFRALGPEARAAWLGHAVAGTLEANVNGACAFQDHLGRLLGIEVASWWRPTALNFFDRVSKTVMAATLTEIEGPALAARYAGSKKAELAATCARICTGDFIGEVAVKDAARTWLPEAMRFAGAEMPAEDAASGGAVTENAGSPEPDEAAVKDREAA